MTDHASQPKVSIDAHFSGVIGDLTLNANLSLPKTGITALFGPSGSGKTTLLRCFAGLTKISNGALKIDGDIWQSDRVFRPPHKRALGYVFQEPSLFDHLTVRENLNFGHKRSRRATEDVSFDETVSLMGLTKLMDRSPEKLSGGEKQRVAIARALLASPRLLLMDEPLSALDQAAKEEIIPYLEKLRRSLSIPIIFVSHDMREIERLADHMILINQGTVTASGPLIELLSDPSLPLAHMDQTAAILTGEIIRFRQDDQLTEIKAGGQLFLIPGEIAAVGEKRRLRIAASDVSLSAKRPSETTILNILPANITAVTPLDDSRVTLFLQIGHKKHHILIARISSLSMRKFDFKPGQSVYAQIKGVSMMERAQS